MKTFPTIRKTLCHELAHNVWGEHDRNFWELTKEIEREVERNDWTRGGHALSSDEFYNPNDGGFDEQADHGGWTGGEFVLGGGGSVGGGQTVMSSASGAEVGAGSLSRREILAGAAEERMKKTRRVESAEHGDGGEGSDADKRS